MKNRLTVARELLKDDGVIFVQCDDNEQAYLKVLMDEVFGRYNFVANLVWEKKSGRQNDARFYSTNHEYILNFAKNIDNFKSNLLNRIEKMLKMYKNPDNDTRGIWASITLQAKSGNEKNRYKIKFPNNIEWEPPIGIYARFSKEKLLELYYDNRLFFGKNKLRLKKFLANVKDGVVSNTLLFASEISNTQKAKSELQILFGKNVFDTPKPEKVLEYLINLATKENNIILDYHLGSGTTCAVAHKMGRCYIGIEQIDYIETVAVERLKKVIAGEQGGISKAVEWQGDGSFTYLELKKYNQTFIEQIEESKDSETLLEIWEQMKEKSFLNYNVDIQKQEECIEDFKKLKLQQQKEHLIALLDKNQLYVNLSSINDKDFEVSKEEKQLTKDFYQIKDKKII